MNSRFWRYGAVLVSSVFSSLTLSAQPAVWIAPSLQRVGKTDALGTGTQAKVYAGRGEYESFQIVVHAPSSGLSNVNVSVSDLTGPGGAVIPKTNISLFREYYVTVTASSPNWGGSNQPLGAGVYPDGLVPFIDPATGQPPVGATITATPFNVSANQNQPIWVDVLVPHGIAGGVYTGTYTVTSSQGNTSGGVSVTVWNFDMPATPSLHSSFLFWNGEGVAAQEELLRNRIGPLALNPSTESTLVNYGLGSTGLPFWSGADVGTCSMSPAPSVSQFQTSAAQQQSGLLIYDYSADEIGGCSGLYTTLKQWAYNMHQAGVKNLVTMAPDSNLYDDGSGTGHSAVDIWTMLPVMYDANPSAVNYVISKGDLAWSYNTVVQDAYSPKWEIDFSPIDFRIQPGFISQSLGLTGLLYWRVDMWSSDPWNQINTIGVWNSSNYPGEGVLVYPGTQVGIQGVAPSMRLKWLRDGTDDYEYVNILKKLGQGSWAMQMAQSVGANWSNWTRDPNALESVREQLGAKIDSLNGGSAGSTGGTTGGTAPAAPANPSPANGATSVSITPTLTWSASSGATSYDVYFGTSSSPALVTTTSSTSYAPATLVNSGTYYWKVVAKNSAGSASSAVWSFITVSVAAPPVTSSVPSKPSNPSPASGATGVSTSATLSWTDTGATSYDVYFGTTSTPVLIGTTTSTSYAMSGLSDNTLYYWAVVANSSAGSNSSPIWSFTTDAPAPSGGGAAPTDVSVSPNSGSGWSHAYTFVFNDPNGAANLSGVGALMNASFNGLNSCWFYYDNTNNTISLASDSEATWSSAPANASAYLQNSQCILTKPKAKITGNTLTLTVVLGFYNTFGGTKNFYMYSQDENGLNSGYQPMGIWTVP